VDALPSWPADEKGIATRKASGDTLSALAPKLPELWGGSADLAESNLTTPKGEPSFIPPEHATKDFPGDWYGRVLHFGIREHAMGSILNGIALHGGTRPYGGTFLVFSDYMRPAVRLAALMQLPVTYVWTHDSIGLGEDGPTHQPVEHLAALRAIPRLNVIRPADANETVRGWQFALNQTEAPTAFALSRQNVATFDPADVPADCIERGAYVLKDSGDGTPDVILMGTGSEVGLCLEAAEKLDADGVNVRVVSMPCMDTFTHADESYREEVLPAACRARVAVEAASPLGWDKWIGEEGCFLGMETFGESGPAKDVYEHFGITADRAVELAKKTREKVGATT
jgi:transketolase